MTYLQFLKENKISEEKLSKEDVWKFAQRQIIADFLFTFTPTCFSFDELDQVIEKINERA